MPAVILRLLSAFTTIVDETTSSEQRRILLRQADAVSRMAELTVSEPNDLEDIRTFHHRLLNKIEAVGAPPLSGLS